MDTSRDRKRASLVISFTCYRCRDLLLHYGNIAVDLLRHRHLWGNILFRGGIFELLSKFSYPCIGKKVSNSYNRNQYGCWGCLGCIIYIIWNILLVFTGAINTQEVTYIYFIRIISHLCAYVTCVKWSADGNRRAASMLWIKSFEQTGPSVVIYHFSLINTTSFSTGIIYTRRQRKGGTYLFICLKTLRLMLIVWSGLDRWDTVSLGAVK